MVRIFRRCGPWQAYVVIVATPRHCPACGQWRAMAMRLVSSEFILCGGNYTALKIAATGVPRIVVIGFLFELRATVLWQPNSDRQRQRCNTRTGAHTNGNSRPVS